tara:strand:- start:349 stop:873 length:525 start_codon:yes stop_codon:yes gene_type:complete
MRFHPKPTTYGEKVKRGQIRHPGPLKSGTSTVHTSNKMKWNENRVKIYLRSLRQHGVKTHTKMEKKGNNYIYNNEACADFKHSRLRDWNEFSEVVFREIVREEGENNLPQNRDNAQIVRNFWSDRKKAGCEVWDRICQACDYYRDDGSVFIRVIGVWNNIVNSLSRPFVYGLRI